MLVVELGDDEEEGDTEDEGVASWLVVAVTEAVGAWLLLDDPLPDPDPDGDVVSLGVCDVLPDKEWLRVPDIEDVAEAEGVRLVVAVADIDGVPLPVEEGLGVVVTLGESLALCDDESVPVIDGLGDADVEGESDSLGVRVPLAVPELLALPLCVIVPEKLLVTDSLGLNDGVTLAVDD